MRMLAALQSAAGLIGRIAEEERSEARAAGVSSYHADAEGRLVEEQPDGRRMTLDERAARAKLDAAE